MHLSRSLLLFGFLGFGLSKDLDDNRLRGGEAGLILGNYHTLITSPKNNGLHFTDKYYLKDKPYLFFELFPKLRFNSLFPKGRLGIRLQYIFVERRSFSDSEYFVNQYEKIGRVYEMFSIWPVYQHSVGQYRNLYFILDGTGGLSVVSSHAESTLGDYCDTIFCSDLSLHLGFQARLRTVLEVREHVRVLVGIGYQLQPGGNSPNFPFSSGFILELGVLGYR